MRLTIDELVQLQAGVVARRQLNALGTDRWAIRNQVSARRWVERTSRVVTTFTGEPTPEQLRWLSVLHAGQRSMLGGLTAAEHHGLRRWEREEITVLVDDELSFEPVDGVDFFRSRRSFELLVSDRPGVPSCRLEPAVLMWAGYDASDRAAHGVLAAAVQQRLTTAPQLLTWVDKLRPLRRAPAFRQTLGEIAGGAHSGAELDIGRLCTRYGLRPPDRQVRRRDSAGRQRFTDCEWLLPQGRTLVLEVDGGFHMEVEHWTADLQRSRRLTTPDRTVVRCTTYELRHEGHQLARDLIALGVPQA